MKSSITMASYRETIIDARFHLTFEKQNTNR